MPFCQPLLATLQAYLWKSRKQLSVLVGAQKAQQPTVSLSPFALQANEFVEVEEIEGVAKDSSPVPANASPLVLQFFQVCALLCTVLSLTFTCLCKCGVHEEPCAAAG